MSLRRLLKFPLVVTVWFFYLYWYLAASFVFGLLVLGDRLLTIASEIFNCKQSDQPNQASSETSVEVQSPCVNKSRKPYLIYIDGISNSDETASAIGVYFGRRHELNVEHRIAGPPYSAKRAIILAAIEALKRLRNSDYCDEEVYVFTENLDLFDCLKNSLLAGKFDSEVGRLRRLARKFSSKISFEHVYPHRKMKGCLEANKLARMALSDGSPIFTRSRKPKRVNHPFETLGVPGAHFSNKQLADASASDTSDYSISSSLMEYVKPVTDMAWDMAESTVKNGRAVTDMAWEMTKSAEKKVQFVNDAAWEMVESGKKQYVQPLIDKAWEFEEVATKGIQEVNNNQIQPLIKSAKNSVREMRKKRLVPLNKMFSID